MSSWIAPLLILIAVILALRVAPAELAPAKLNARVRFSEVVAVREWSKTTAGGRVTEDPVAFPASESTRRLRPPGA